MATSERRYGAADIDLARAKRYVRSSGSGSAPKPHRGNAYSSVRNIEIDSGGLYRFEKMVRMAFVQVMKEDVVFGQKDSIIAYIAGLSNDFEGPVVSDIDWQPDQSSARMSEFMMSFYSIYSYWWERRGRSTKESLGRYLEILRDCLDLGYLQVCQGLDSLPREAKNTIDKAFFLTNSRIDDWYGERMAELSKA